MLEFKSEEVATNDELYLGEHPIAVLTLDIFETKHIFLAIENDDYLSVQYLLNNPSFDNIDTPDQKGITALMLAVQYGNIDIISLLLEHNASINVKDNEGNTPLMWAVKLRNEKVINFLLKNNADPNQPDNKHNTPLHYAICQKSYPIIELLLSNKANPDVPFGEDIADGWLNAYTPVTASIRDGDERLFNILVENGASLLKRDNNGRSPLIAADNALSCLTPKKLFNLLETKHALESDERITLDLVLVNSPKLLESVLDKTTSEFRQKSFNQTDEHNKKPLTIAFENRRIVCARVLIDYGADIENREDVKIRLCDPKFHEILNTYYNNLKAHENTPMLTLMAADRVYRNAKDYNFQIEDIGLPEELVELCKAAPKRFDVKSRYMKPQEIKDFLEEVVNMSHEELVDYKKQTNNKRRRTKK